MNFSEGAKMNSGYARVSTKEQTVDLQVDALKKAACTKVYTEIMSGIWSERPIYWRISGQETFLLFGSSIARSPCPLAQTPDRGGQRIDDAQDWLKSLNDPIDTTTPQGPVALTSSPSPKSIGMSCCRQYRTCHRLRTQSNRRKPAGGGEPLLKSVPVHAIELRQIEPSYNVRLRWVYIQRFLKETGNGGSTEPKKSRAPIPKRSREELLASPARDFDHSTGIQIATRHEQQPRPILKKNTCPVSSGASCCAP